MKSMMAITKRKEPHPPDAQRAGGGSARAARQGGGRGRPQQPSKLMAVDREFCVARTFGAATLRVVLHEELFFRQGDVFLDNVGRLLAMLAHLGMVAMLVL